MEVQFGPNSVDNPNLLYKLQHKIKVFNTANPLPNRGYNLVASCSKYGIVFVGAPDGTLSTYYLSQLIDKDCDPQHISVKLPEKPTHIAVSCDQELLAVTGGQLLCIYKIADFQNQNVSPSAAIKCDGNSSSFVSALQWNPCIPDSIAVAFYDGLLLAYQVSTNQVKKVPSKARCICWSPKGKQLVTGNSDGTLCQYKPDLTPAKTVPAPNLFQGASVEALAIHWISTFQFAVVYKNATDNSRPSVTIINTPKAGTPTCINYEDICYSIGSNRPWYYYLLGLAQWNIILSSSSNSMEIATLSSTDGVNWAQWCQADEARPELPLTDKKQENYPVGVCLDTCAIHQLPWGENELLPHMPLLLVVSQTGLLTVFNMINLNKQATPMCSPPQPIALCAALITSSIPDDAPAQPAPPPVAAPLAQPKPIPAQTQEPVQEKAQPPAPVIQTQVASKPQSQVFQPQNIPSFVPAAVQQADPKPAADVKPVPTPQPTAVQPTSSPVIPKPQVAAENAALKAEQERINKMKVNQELKSMLIKEVNDFQMELYTFMVKTRETQAKLQRDIDAINSNFSFNSVDAAQLKKDCSLEELRGGIAQLKLELVRACAVIAEARTHAEAKDYQQWTQVDPLTAKRVSSVKKLAYYVQTQLEQAQKALDFQWNEKLIKDQHSEKPGHRMIRPILDDVYQPLVKQQEILSRQQAMLRTLKSTLKEFDITPMFKSTSLLRNTPFRNKDPLSKLTKNILNMSIEPQTKTKEPLLSAQKLDALRDALSNHKTIKIKPVNVELRQHLAAMRLSYEKAMKEKANTHHEMPKVVVKTELEKPIKVEPAPTRTIIKVEPKQEPVKQPVIAVPSFTPLSNLKPAPGLGNVARTLFADEPTKEPAKPSFPQPTKPQQATKPVQSAFATPASTASANTRSVLKDLLQSKSQASLEAKNDANTFMGQKICSPSAFSFSGAPSATAAPNTLFTSKPIADINNMFNKFQTQPFISESKPANVKSSETGEPEAMGNKAKAEKTMTNLFAMKTSTPIATSASTVPDVLKSKSPEASQLDTKPKPVDKVKEKLKANEPEKPVEILKPVPKVADDKENIVKPLGSQAINKPSIFSAASAQQIVTSTPNVSREPQTEPKSDIPDSKEALKTIDKSETIVASSNAASLFASVNTPNITVPKPQPNFGSSAASTDTTTIATQEIDTKPSLPEIAASVSASSIFGAAVATTPQTSTPSTASIFGTTPSSSPAGVFGSAVQESPFATTTSTQSSVFAPTTVSSSLSSTTDKPSVFSTPTPASPSSVFGAATAQTASSVFASAASVFAPASPPTTTQASVFGSSTASVFGSASSSPASVFGNTTSSSPPFGTTTATTKASVFGSNTAVTTPSAFSPTTAASAASVFGSAVTTSQSLFGSSTATTQSSVFGTTPTPGSVFGSAPSSPASVFGAATNQASVFGAQAPSTQTSVFGTPSPTTQASVFGTPTQTTQASVFGTPTSQPSIFGSPPATTAQSGSLFGGAEANLFASASISTTSAPTQSTGGNIFGGGSSGSVFGSSNTNVFGGKSAFGQPNTSATSIFGGGATFGQKPATDFWSGGGNTSGGGFGSGFGQPTTQASIFGGGSGGSFSAPSAGAFGSPQGSAFGGEANASVFGSPQQQQQTAPAFGGSPVFGSKPVFGQTTGFGSPNSGSGFGSFGGFSNSPSAGFGAPAAFGGGATFGGSAFGNTSPGKMFGGSPQPGFGSPTQSNATFENLATQNTLTFGNLAQQSGTPTQQASGFNTSPSFTGWRG